MKEEAAMCVLSVLAFLLSNIANAVLWSDSNLLFGLCRSKVMAKVSESVRVQPRSRQ